MAWTDERLDDLAGRMDAGFERTDLGLHNLRIELKGDIADLRTELKGDIGGLRSMMFRFGIAMMVGMAGVIATLIGAITTGSMSG